MKSNVLNHASKSSDITFRKLLVNDDSGECGEDANYSFNASSGELTIFGFETTDPNAPVYDQLNEQMMIAKRALC